MKACVMQEVQRTEIQPFNCFTQPPQPRSNLNQEKLKREYDVSDTFFSSATTSRWNGHAAAGRRHARVGRLQRNAGGGSHDSQPAGGGRSTRCVRTGENGGLAGQLVRAV